MSIPTSRGSSSASPSWPGIPAGWGVAHGDTAGSAQYVAQTGDITKAAICSSRAAELYGLEILARGVNYNSNNTTRFVVVSPVMELREGADKISAVLSLPDEVGSLHEVLTIFAVHGLNLVKLESRPLPGRSWEYLFFLEFDGSLADPAMDGALQELSQASAEMRVLGNFKKQSVRRRGDGQGCAYHRSFLGIGAAVARRFARGGLACGG